MLYDDLNSKNIGKMPEWRLDPARLWESDKECHNDAVGVQVKLEAHNVKELEDLIYEWVKGKENLCLQDRLANGHEAHWRKMLSFIWLRRTIEAPKSVLAGHGSHLLNGYSGHPVLAYIVRTNVLRSCSTGRRTCITPTSACTPKW